jgi:hypothetical protein
MSVAVLRYFVEQRKRELEAGTFKNRKGRLAAESATAAAKAADGADANGSPAQPVRARCPSAPPIVCKQAAASHAACVSLVDRLPNRNCL